MVETPVVELPGDKSLTHRAMLLAALATGESTIEHPLTSLDARSMAAVLRRLGVAVSPLRGRLRVVGRGRSGLVRPRGTLHCGNSGTAARLLLGVLAACPFTARVTGDRSLRGRPMRRVTHPLRRMGAEFVEHGGDGLPLEVHGGSLRPIDYATETASAQVKSAILFAGLVAGVAASVTEPFPSRDHTERMLRALGAPVLVDGTTVRFKPVEAIPSFDVTIPGDPSSAAFLIAAALLAETGGVTLRNMLVNPTRLGFIRVLQRMGADIEIREISESLGEPVGEVLVRASSLAGTDVEAPEVPSLIDEIPVLAVVATAAAGETKFKGVSELRVKESDRLHLLAANLEAVGAACRVEDDDLHVSGGSEPPRGNVETGFDHRMAMAFAVLGRRPGGAVELSEDRSPQVSYPGFFEALDRVAPHG